MNSMCVLDYLAGESLRKFIHAWLARSNGIHSLRWLVSSGSMRGFSGQEKAERRAVIGDGAPVHAQTAA
jgi:hypothetical protein